MSPRGKCKSAHRGALAFLLCSAGRTRTYNQLLTRSPTLLRAWTISSSGFFRMRGASSLQIRTTPRRDSLYTFPALAGLGSGLPRIWGSPNSPRYSIRLTTKGCLSTGSCSTIELPRNIRTVKNYTHFSAKNNLNTWCYNIIYMLKLCSVHGSTKHFPRPDGAYRCGKCASSWVIQNRRRKKERLVELFGGKCKLCGYKKYAGALDFHHLDPRAKVFALSVKGLSYSWDSLVREAEKCVLVCKNCHTELEAGLAKL